MKKIVMGQFVNFVLKLLLWLPCCLHGLVKSFFEILPLFFLCCRRSRCNDASKVAKVSALDAFYLEFCMTCRFFRFTDVCSFLAKRYGSLCEVELFGQRIVVTSRYEDCKLMKKKDLLIQRFGNLEALKNVNMADQGLIWNNESAAWKKNRKFFESVLRKSSKMIKSEALKFLTDNPIPLCERFDFFSFLRRFTLSLTLKTIFGITDSKGVRWEMETLQVVANYFKAWEFFLTAPDSSRFPKEKMLHQQSAKDMKAKGEELLVYMHGQENCMFLEEFEKSMCDKRELVQCICEFLLAGTDTSSITMYNVLLECSKTSLSVASVDLVNLYFESMRLSPVGPLILRQATQDLDEQGRDGIRLAKGDGIIFHIAEMNMAHYSDPYSFHPGRFKGEKPKEYPCSFGAGAKGCVGKDFAEKEMSCFLEHFFQNYTVLLAKDDSSSTETQWDVASVPRNPSLMFAFPNKFVFFVGQGSTGKTHMLKMFQRSFTAGLAIVPDSAREQMKEQNLKDADLLNNDVLRRLQTHVIQKQWENMTANHGRFCIFDGSLIDAYAYDQELTPDIEELKKHIVVFFPFTLQYVQNDGIRIAGKYEKDEIWLGLLSKLDKFYSLKSLNEKDRFQEILQIIKMDSR